MKDTWIATKLCGANGVVWGITVDNNGIIYFVAGSSENVYQVRQDINPEPQFLVNITGARLRGIVWNGNNILYICDNKNHRILSYSIDTGNLSTLAGSGKEGHKDGNIHDAQFMFPQGIAMDRHGDLYITQFHCIRKINVSEGTVTTIAGSDAKGYKDGDAKQAMFSSPCGIAVSGNHTIYVADWGNHCIRKLKDGIVSTIAGTPGNRGNQDGPLSHSQFNYPKTLAMNVDDILIDDHNGLRRVDLNQQIVSTLIDVSSTHVCSLAMSRQFGYFAGGNDFIRKIENSWKWKRLIWIGHSKENPNDCLLAILPRDIIKEITYMMDY